MEQSELRVDVIDLTRLAQIKVLSLFATGIEYGYSTLFYYSPSVACMQCIFAFSVQHDTASSNAIYFRKNKCKVQSAMCVLFKNSLLHELSLAVTHSAHQQLVD